MPAKSVHSRVPEGRRAATDRSPVLTRPPFAQAGRIGISLVLLLVLFTARIQAATNLVRAGNYWFNPTNLTIAAGDTVLWTNVSFTAHDSTGPTNLWTSPTFAFTGTYQYRFTNLGVYPYICALHIAAHPEQTGTVSVVSSGPAPAVALSSPRTSGNDFIFSFASQAGASYEVQQSTALPPTQWTGVTNLTGTGSPISVTNRRSASPSFYRVESR